MFKKVAPYMGEYKKYTFRAVMMMCIGIVAKIMPYFFLYQIVSPLTKGQSISLEYVMLRVFGILLSEIIYSFAYVKGLIFFQSMNLHTTLQCSSISFQDIS